MRVKINGDFVKEDAMKLIKFAKELSTDSFKEISYKSGFNEKYKI